MTSTALHAATDPVLSTSTSLELARPLPLRVDTPQWALLATLLFSYLLPPKPVRAKHVAPRRRGRKTSA